MKMIHPFHMVTNSPWPLILSINLMNFFMSMLLWLNFMNKNHLIFNIIITLTTLMIWWRDIIRESTYQGFHTNMIHSFMKFSMILFIISEMFFFMAFFWSYFHSSISPNIEIGMSWPPKFIMIFNPYDIPLLNTIILISSSFTLTISHYKMMMNNFLMSKKYLILTLILSLYFSLLQYIEYKNSLFCINDSIYGSIFFMTTGFHGLHVMIGSMFLLSSLIRINLNHFSYTHHFNFTASIWYWHFVDLIWLFLYLSIYWFMY